MAKWVNWRPEELAWIEAHCALPRREAHAIFCRKFDRDDVSADAFKNLCTRNGWKTGRDGSFPPGHVPANNGKKMPFNANSAATQFKKGQLPHNTKYLGHERLSKDGYVEISVDQINPHTGYERRYVAKHVWLWEKAHGPVPKGMCLKCLDGNRTNTAPSNWEAIPRAMLPLLGPHRGIDYDAAEPELKPAIMALAKLKHRVRIAKTPTPVATKARRVVARPVVEPTPRRSAKPTAKRASLRERLARREQRFNRFEVWK